MKKDIVVAAVAVVVVLLLAFGLSQFRPNLPSTSSRTSAGDESADASKSSGSGKVVMRVNGDPITDREFAMFMKGVPEQQRAFYTSPAGRKALADELVKLKVLEQEAKRLGVTDDAEVREQIQIARAQIIAAKALEKLANEKVEEKIKAEYAKERAGAISLRHILIAYAGGAVPARGGKAAPSPDAAMQRAQAISAQLRGGADFALTAQKESDDERSGANGGLIGPARLDKLSEMMPAEIVSVVSKLKPGETSEPVKTQFGVHIFKVEAPSLEELEPELRQRVRQQTAESELKRLTGGAKVDYDKQFFPEQPNATQPAPKSEG
ncbi:MAG: peptidylprolyl isomerase [Acidobacteriota bacterium]|nr:peptidylprolyl isomerase [Acidobacteriota bacterium]